MRGVLRTVAIDAGPLRRHRDFRLLFAGQLVSLLGSTVTYVALPFQAYSISGSSLVVGLLGAAAFVPLIGMALVGGALADARDRRRMVQLTELGFAAASAALLLNSLLGSPRLWVLFVCAMLMAALDGLQRPSLDALVPRLVEREELPAAAALGSFRGTVGMVAGPALGGVLIAGVGLPSTYGVDVATFLFSLVTLRLMRAVPPAAGAQRASIARIREGLRYARGRQDLLGTYTVDIVAMLFGMPDALFPAVASHHGGAGVLGLLYAAPGAGSLLATVTSGWTRRVVRHGRAICLAAAAWGAAVTCFGLTDRLGVALGFLVLAGAADMLSGLFRSVIWNSTIPDELRGRLAGVEQVSYSAGPLLGDVESGLAASLIGVRGAIVSGGLLCVAGVAVVALAMPALWRYRPADI